MAGMKDAEPGTQRPSGDPEGTSVQDLSPLRRVLNGCKDVAIDGDTLVVTGAGGDPCAVEVFVRKTQDKP